MYVDGPDVGRRRELRARVARGRRRRGAGRPRHNDNNNNNNDNNDNNDNNNNNINNTCNK